MVFSWWLWSRTKLMMTKNTCQTLAILKAMHIRWCNAGCIAWWSASAASCKATRCRHWASARAALPRRLPWSTISKRKKNTNKTQLLPSFLTVDQCKKSYRISRSARDPLLTSSAWLSPTLTLKPESSWRAQLHFELSNVANGQKFEKLLSLNEARKNLWRIYAPVAVILLTPIIRWKHDLDNDDIWPN